MTENHTNNQKQQIKRSNLDKKIYSIYSKTISKIGGIDQQNKNTQLKINNPNVIKGGLIGVAITAFIRWNMVKYSRLGILIKRWILIKHFIQISHKPAIPFPFTNYYTPNLQTPAKNFMCYSGEAGIGKSTHFMNLAYTQSKIRPAFYFSFKFAGKDNNSFEEDIAQQAGWGQNSPGILSQTIKAIKKIDYINKYPSKFWLKTLFTHILIASSVYGIAISSIDATYGIVLFSLMGVSYLYYLSFLYPLMIQSFRRTCPVIIFDDLNKIQQLNMFSQIVRYLQVLQNGMANVILISPDQDTWCKLRRQPGVKDRLRVKQIYYNHIYTAEIMLKYISDDKNFESYMKCINGNKLYTKNIVISLAKELIGKRQVTLRRFTSILILNDQQEYEKLVKVLKECSQGKINTGQAVQQFTDILYESQSKTMVANLKSIKRQINLTQQQFLQQLKILLKKKKLPSDNQIAPHLKAYNIVRDLQSDYIFNGRFMFTVFNIAIKEYEKNSKDYKQGNSKQIPIMQPNSIGSTQNNQIASTDNQQKNKQLKNTPNIKDWNNSNTMPIQDSPKIQKP